MKTEDLKRGEDKIKKNKESLSAAKARTPRAQALSYSLLP